MLKVPQHKKFNYQYRYFKPTRANPGRPIKFKRISRRGQAGSILLYAILLSLILWILV